MNSTSAYSLTITDNTTHVSDVSPDTSTMIHVAKLLGKVFPPVITVLGTFGNILSIIIMSRVKSGDTAVNILFMAIAFGDLMVLYTGVVAEWIQNIVNVQLIVQWPLLHHLRIYLVTCSGAVVSWLLVCVTLQRALSVVWPHRVNLMLSRKRVQFIIGGVAVILAGLYSHYIYAIFDTDSTSSYAWFAENVFSFVDLAVFSVLPFVCLVIGNSVLTAKLVASMNKTRNIMVNANSQQFDQRDKMSNSVTLTVLVVSFTFIALTLPSCVYFILFNYKDQTQMVPHEFLLSTITIMLTDSNSAVNFYIYCLTGRRFRKEFVKIVRCGPLS